MDKANPGDLVILTAVPPALLRGLPKEDQKAIRAIVGHPVTFVGISYGQAELEFIDSEGDGHTIWVDEDLIRPISPADRAKGA
jgi:hypothetical protein